MNKETLIQFARELHWEAFDANTYFLIIQQYRKSWKEHKDEIRLSPAFYNIVYAALQKACFMEIAKLYDKSNKVVSINSLLKDCQENISLFPEYRDTISIEDNGNTYSSPIPYQHQLKFAEECFFKSEVESPRAFFKAFDIPNAEKTPVTIDLTFTQFLELYQKRFHSLSKKQECIREQRNKIYAHNDEQRILDLNSVLENNPISYSDIKELIDFALDCTMLIFRMLTGECLATQYVNIDDWNNTLALAQLGLKYQEYDHNQRKEAFEKEIAQQLRGDNHDKLQ